MRGRWKRLARMIVAMSCAAIFGSAGADFFSVPKAFGQSVFQNYAKPQAAPDFSIQNLQGKQVDFRDHRGQVILLNFWATW